jgi:hypothetical protein
MRPAGGSALINKIEARFVLFALTYTAATESVSRVGLGL